VDHSPADRAAEAGVMICVFKHSGDFTSDKLIAVRTFDAEQRLIITSAVQAAFVQVESFSRQLSVTF